jgi:hypothetical protein
MSVSLFSVSARQVATLVLGRDVGRVVGDLLNTETLDSVSQTGVRFAVCAL